MRLDIEVRSSGHGPRARYESLGAHLQAGTAFAWSHRMAERWTRHVLDHKARLKRPCDGVVVIIRRAE
jgi:hypothetical protein